MIAEHIIGLSAVELGRYEYGDEERKQAVASSIRRRFKDIKTAGKLRPRGETPLALDDPGSQHDYDILAGDARYVFLSAGTRYRRIRNPDICFGFTFDAETLVAEGALVGPDLLDDYTSLLNEIAEEVDTSLPPLPSIPEDELNEFANRMGISDPGMLEFIRQESISRFYDIVNGVKSGNTSIPGVEEALKLWHERVPLLQARKRKSGQEALAMLRDCKDGHLRIEILVNGNLDLDQATAFIKAGRIKAR